METTSYAFAIEHADSGDVTLLLFDRRDDADSAYEDITRTIDDIAWSDVEISCNNEIKEIISSANEKLDIDADDAYGDNDEWELELDGATVHMIAAEPIVID